MQVLILFFIIFQIAKIINSSKNNGIDITVSEDEKISDIKRKIDEKNIKKQKQQNQRKEDSQKLVKEKKIDLKTYLEKKEKIEQEKLTKKLKKQKAKKQEEKLLEKEFKPVEKDEQNNENSFFSFDQTELQKAMIIKEILDKPVSLRR